MVVVISTRYAFLQITSVHNIIIIITLFWSVNGRIDLNIIRNRDNPAKDVPAVCVEDQLRLSCVASGSTHLRWNNSPGATFTSHDAPRSTRTLVDQNHNLSFVAVLMHITHTSDSNGESQFFSELHSQNNVMLTASSATINISCSTDISASSLPIIVIAAPPQKPVVTTATFNDIQYQGNNWNSSTSWLYYVKWKPPSNTDKFILNGYILQIANKTIRIEKSKTEEFFGFNESVTTGTLTAVSICGTTSANVTVHFTQDSHSVTTTSSAGPAPQATNRHDTLSMILISILGLISIVLSIAVLALIAIIVCILKTKNMCTSNLLSRIRQTNSTLITSNNINTV